MIETEYLQRMMPRLALFYFYSFSVYPPIRTVCSQITKALRGRRSETVSLDTPDHPKQMILDVYNELIPLVRQASAARQPSMAMCGWGCLRALLGIHATDELLRVALAEFPALLERVNSALDLSDEPSVLEDAMLTVAVMAIREA